MDSSLQNKNPFVLGVIPARYASTRFPGKPLIDILGMSMLERVYRQTLQSKSLTNVCIATDDKRIFDHAKQFGANVFMTSDKHPSGTDRCLEAVELFLKAFPDHTPNIIVNIQGDEPLIQPHVIDELVSTFLSPETRIATMVVPFINNQDVQNTNSVKVVFNKESNALYFSRLPIPYKRDSQESETTYYKHLGLYAFRYKTLQTICTLPMSSLEKTEKLEQLRWIENAIPIRIVITEQDSLCVDVPDDVQRIIQVLIKQNTHS
jgi:3-deoxy-manno-octulosonate cytidylyltransferase (CMP-KDO synthetase)